FLCVVGCLQCFLRAARRVKGVTRIAIGDYSAVLSLLVGEHFVRLRGDSFYNVAIDFMLTRTMALRAVSLRRHDDVTRFPTFGSLMAFDASHLRMLGVRKP